MPAFYASPGSRQVENVTLTFEGGNWRVEGAEKVKMAAVNAMVAALDT